MIEALLKIKESAEVIGFFLWICLMAFALVWWVA